MNLRLGKMSKLLIATNNQGKQEEIRSLLSTINIKLVTPAELDLNLDVKESGYTYKENASIKATTFSRKSGLISLADDTGLEVDALEGNPGLFSARYSPLINATDADRRAYLLKQLLPHPQPWIARFFCVVAIATTAGHVYFSEGSCPGQIIPQERGKHGFGYDQIFLLPSIGKTMAELILEEKNQLSHRAIAVMKSIPTLLRLLVINESQEI